MNTAPDVVTDELLYAFLDGELDPAARSRVMAAIDADPALAQRVTQRRALRQMLRAQFDPVLEEPIPSRLLTLAAQPDAAAVDLAQARAQREPPVPRRPAWQSFGAQAAALALGVLLGALLFTRGGAQLYIEHEGQLAARGALRSALSGRLGEDAPADGVSIGLSVRTTEGEICRSFQLDAGQAGLACRRNGEWRIDMLTRAARAGGEYRQAASALPDSLRLAIEARASGEPLSAEEEAIARAADWRAE
ncbi:MAG: hypothetical protein ABW278_01675 [Steroidobacteraceae bacterium]